MSSMEINHEELRKVMEKLKNTESEAVHKDKQISELLARLREYEMGEFGLAEAVAEIKECKKLLRLRDREIEALANQLNNSKLHAQKLNEKLEDLQLKAQASVQHSLLYFGETSVHSTKPKISLKSDDVNVQKQCAEDKMCQCYISVYPLNSLNHISATQIQNEKLRTELNKICEEFTEILLYMKNDSRKDFQSPSEYEMVINKLKENLETLEAMNESLSTPANVRSPKDMEKLIENQRLLRCFPQHDVEPADCYKFILKRIEQEDIEVQEIFHEFTNQIKVLKQKQTALIRQCQALSEYGIEMRKDNEKLKRNFPESTQPDFIYKYKVEFPSLEIENDDGKDILCDIKPSSLNGDECTKPECVTNRKNIVKLVVLVKNFLKEISNLRNLLKISHHQAKDLESICFAKEMELKSVLEQLILFQIQSDEKLLLGKLALKVLQLQFTNASCAYELQKYKLDRTTLQKWYTALLRDHEENEIKLSSAYVRADTKVKNLMDILQDVGQRCNEAVSSYNHSPI